MVTLSGKTSSGESDEYFSPTINFRHKQLFPQQMILPKKSILLKDKEKMEKDEETVTLDDPITNQTKEAPVVIIDWFMVLKVTKKSKKGYSQI